jgi:hypothetical protein
MPKTPRPNICESAKRELWARAAGRCEFRGCNKILHTHSLTRKKSNLGKISHIVAHSPDGPRGDPEDSPRLAKDISNLMLTCHECGKMIDDRDKVEEYPTDLLREFKREHEDRVRRLTSIQPDAQTHVLIVQANIGGQPVRINRQQVFNAVLPMYPTNEDRYEIDLTDTMLTERDDGFWDSAALDLSRRVSSALHAGPRGELPNHVSVFALAPIPLLVKLGTVLGSINEIEVYQKHRDGNSWAWQDDDEAYDAYYRTTEHDTREEATQVAVMVSLSSRVMFEEVQRSMRGDFAAYEIAACDPGVDFMRSRSRLNLFGYEYRKLLAMIRQRHRRAQELHLFAAAPSPVAVLCGQSLSPKIDPAVVLYEYRRPTYAEALRVNLPDEGAT